MSEDEDIFAGNVNSVRKSGDRLYRRHLRRLPLAQAAVRITATGLCAGMLIDATIVRGLLVPAMVSLMGHWNWWLPTWPQWLVPKDAQTGA